MLSTASAWPRSRSTTTGRSGARRAREPPTSDEMPRSIASVFSSSRNAANRAASAAGSGAAATLRGRATRRRRRRRRAQQRTTRDTDGGRGMMTARPLCTDRADGVSDRGRGTLCWSAHGVSACPSIASTHWHPRALPRLHRPPGPHAAPYPVVRGGHAPNRRFPSTSIPHEQVVVVLDGELELVVAGDCRIALRPARPSSSRPTTPHRGTRDHQLPRAGHLRADARRLQVTGTRGWGLGRAAATLRIAVHPRRCTSPACKVHHLAV